MTQIQFITELEQALRGNVDERVIQENVRYYNSYISEQKAAGKSEKEIFASLGSPRLIAKTIIDTSGEANTQGSSRSGSYDYNTGRSSGSSNGGDGWSFSWVKETASQNWLTKIIAVVAVIVAAFLILSIIGWVAKILFKPAVVVLAIAAVYYLVKRSSSK